MATVIELDPALDEAVQELIRGGRFETADAVIRAGVRLVQKREHDRADLDASIERAFADIDAGRVHDIDDVRAELLDRYANWPPQPE